MKSLLILLSIIVFSSAFADNNSYGPVKDKIDQSQLNWILDRHPVQESRGGSTNGLEPEIDTKISKSFDKIHNTFSKKEKDKLAILAMAGEHKANFEFTEIFGSKPNYNLDNPYKSWGTETIIVIENSENFISLQHILAMFTKDKKGVIRGPFVQKHWRQDWTYEDKKILEFQGNNEWVIKDHKNIRGSWSQAVYQVDDSPRYESYGTWVHEKGASRWISQITKRPLPRREHTIRNDYDLLQGINKISILPWGWVMEESNDKIKNPSSFVGAEYGLARYQRVKNYDFNSAYDYWNSTKEYWDIVRYTWDDILFSEDKFCLRKEVKNSPLFMHHFAQAELFKDSNDKKAAAESVKETISNFKNDACSL